MMNRYVKPLAVAGMAGALALRRRDGFGGACARLGGGRRSVSRPVR